MAFVGNPFASSVNVGAQVGKVPYHPSSTWVTLPPDKISSKDNLWWAEASGFNGGPIRLRIVLG